jgi:hypothetical protein
MELFGFFDVLVLAIGGHFVVKIITTWLKTKEGVMRRHVQQLSKGGTWMRRAVVTNWALV